MQQVGSRTEFGRFCRRTADGGSPACETPGTSSGKKAWQNAHRLRSRSAQHLPMARCCQPPFPECNASAEVLPPKSFLCEVDLAEGSLHGKVQAGRFLFGRRLNVILDRPPNLDVRIHAMARAPRTSGSQITRPRRQPFVRSARCERLIGEKLARRKVDHFVNKKCQP